MFGEYIGTVGSSILRNVADLQKGGFFSSHPIGTATRKNIGDKLPVKPTGEYDPLECCIYIGIQKKLTEKIDLPSEFEGYKVFYHFCGKIRYL